MLVFIDVIISLFDILFLAVLLFIINIYSQSAPTAHTGFLPQWMKDKDSLLPIGIFLSAFSIKNFCGYLLQKAEYHFVYKVAARLSGKHLLRYFEGSFRDYTGIDSSVHIQSVRQHPIEFGHYILSGFQQIITQSVLITAALTGILLFNAKLFALLFLLLLPPVLLMAYFIKKKTRSARQKTKSTGEKTMQYLKEALSSYVESKVYGKKDFFLKRYLGWQQQLNHQLADLQQVQAVSGRLLEVFAILGLFILIIVNRWTGSGNAFNVTVIGAFMAAAYKIIPGIVKILNCSGQIRAYSFTISDLLKKEKQEPPADPVITNSIQSIAFNNVSFSYGNQPLLTNLNLNAVPGDFVGISGPSGKGKTSIFNLLLGFEEPLSGEILINETAVDSSARQQFLQYITYVKQQPFLIHDSLHKNIILDDAVADEKKLSKILTTTGLDELLNNFTEGPDKLITENGKNISGGQQQRIVIARALYKDADLILLDEPFNELDKLAEQKLLQHFKDLSEQGKIVILITHNKESLSYCNKIISLE